MPCICERQCCLCDSQPSVLAQISSYMPDIAEEALRDVPLSKAQTSLLLLTCSCIWGKGICTCMKVLSWLPTILQKAKYKPWAFPQALQIFFQGFKGRMPKRLEGAWDILTWLHSGYA